MVLIDQKIPEKQIERINRKCDFYLCEEGEIEIFNLMLDAKLFQPISEKDIPLRNYAIQKLTELGFNQEDKIRKAIHEFLRHPVLDVKEKTGDK